MRKGFNIAGYLTRATPNGYVLMFQEDFVYVCDGAYTRRQITSMEREMICAVEFDVGYPLTYRFLRRYGRVNNQKYVVIRNRSPLINQ